MRLFLILCWLALPLLAWAYHVGPGQDQLAIDDANAMIRRAALSETKGDYTAATDRYADALAKLPEGNADDRFAIQLAMAKTQMNSGKLPEARVALEGLLDAMESADDCDPSLIVETRNTLASSQYYMTWLMRLEGLPAEEWEPEIEASRQHYRMLAETSRRQEGEQDAEQFAAYQQDLESAIRLARMDLSELHALKIPTQCKGCCSGQCDRPGKKQSKKPGKKKGAGSNLGPLPDGSGS